MTDRETLIRMAQEIAEQCVRSGPPTWTSDYAMSRVMELMNATAAAEREQCAQVCDEQGKGRRALEHYAALTYSGAAHDCAAAIRARGESK